MVYEESGSPCVDTCTHSDTSSLCEDHKMDGCFCPPGQGCSHMISVPSLITFKVFFFQTQVSVNVCVKTGTVFDDISLRGCIAQSECQCKHNKIYNAGEVYRQDRKEWYVQTVFLIILLYLFCPACQSWYFFC